MMTFFDYQMENRIKQWQIPPSIWPFVSTVPSSLTILKERNYQFCYANKSPDSEMILKDILTFNWL